MHQVTYFDKGVRKEAEFIGSAAEIRNGVSEGR